MAQSVGGAFTPGESLFPFSNLRLKLRMLAEMVKHCSLNSTETKVVSVSFHLRNAEPGCLRIAVFGQAVDNRPAWVAERKHTANFVVRFASSIVTRSAYSRVRKMVGTIR